MTTVPLVLDVVLPALGVLVILGVVVALVLALRGSGDDWSTARRGGSAGDDVVCPRCHHKTPPDATNCPECGKKL